MIEEIIEITHAIYRMDCTGHSTMKLYYNDSESIACSGYGTLSLDTTKASGKQISVASDMKLKYSHFNYLTREWPTHYKTKVTESLRWCGIKHVSDDIYELPTIDFEARKRVANEKR